jgi:hypothetical protein
VTVGEAIDHVMRRVAELGLGRASECYSVSEAVYILAGKKDSGLTVHRESGHWFLRGPYGEIIDLTAGQFDGPDCEWTQPSYFAAKRAAFYPRVSNLAKRLMA